jgi:hypothetical protein
VCYAARFLASVIYWNRCTTTMYNSGVSIEKVAEHPNHDTVALGERLSTAASFKWSKFSHLAYKIRKLPPKSTNFVNT